MFAEGPESARTWERLWLVGREIEAEARTIESETHLELEGPPGTI